MSTPEPATGTADQNIPAGAEAPSTLVYELSTKDINLDFTTVTTALLRVRHGNGQLEDMPADIDSGTLTATFIKITRQLLATDFPEPDLVRFFPLLSFSPGGDVAGPSRTLEVVSRFTFRE